MSTQSGPGDFRLRQLEFETLLDIINELNSFDTVNGLLDNILEKSCGILDASAGIILIADSNSDYLNTTSVFNIDINLMSKVIFTQRKGFLVSLKTSRKKTMCLLTSEDPALHKSGHQFAIAAPLLNKQKLFGAIILFDKESRKGSIPFDPSDGNMLSAIAIQLGIAYNNIVLLQSIRQAKIFNDNVMESIATGVMTIDLLGEINHINKAATRVLNLEKEQVLGNHYEYILAENEHLIQMIVQSESELVSKAESQLLLMFNGKSTRVNVSVSPLLNDQHEHIGSVIAMEDLSNINKLKSTFQKYVSRQIVDKLLDNEEMLNLGGQELQANVLFSDIRGFTAMSEKMSPKEVVQTLNEYFNQMIEIIFRNNGTLDKIIGDALMVVFGAPLSDERDPENAVITAIEMQHKLAELNIRRVIEQKEILSIGIGINSGPVISGNIGSTQQMNYTVIGDSVNLASRLCSAALPGQVIVSEPLWQKVKSQKRFRSKVLPGIHVKGKSEMIAIRSIVIDQFRLDEVHLNQIIQDFYSKNIADQYVYHSPGYIQELVGIVKSIGKAEKVTRREMNDLLLAASLLHSGLLWQYEDHKDRSARYAESVLAQLGIEEARIQCITAMILATKPPLVPQTHLEKILCDAEYDYLGRSDYHQVSNRLLLEIQQQSPISEIQFLNMQERFLLGHIYFTQTSIRKRMKQKQTNLLDTSEKILKFSALKVSV
ncbi:MAG TPA: adenylate/guanylate cyclase domain-containing protein [Flavitalea sp.]|nr:adenylate/guanylate cyclase domain-containing protein [Flavitalea sp.]